MPELHDLLQSWFLAIKAGQWSVVVGTSLLLVLVIASARASTQKWIPQLRWLNTERGAVVLAMTTALLGGLGHALAAGQPFTWTLLWTALGMAWAAGGAYTGLRKLLGLKKEE